jgi:hypothetical protein
VVDGSAKFRFVLDCIDHDGRHVQLPAPLLFVAAHRGGSKADRDLIRAAYTSDPDHVIPADGQSIAYAPSATPGDTVMETVRLRFTGDQGPPGRSPRRRGWTLPTSSCRRCATSHPLRR